MPRLYASDFYRVDLPAGHRFPMDKYELLRNQLVYRGVYAPEDIVKAEPVPDAWVEWAHSAEYWARARALNLTRSEVRLLGFPLTEALVLRSRASVGGTCAAALDAARTGFGGCLAGGTHHAYPDRGEAYCLINDVGIACHVLLNQGLARRPLIIDLDVHQGNGTAAMFAHDPRVFTFSVHGEANYPGRKERSDLDIALPPNCPDGTYLRATTQGLHQVLDTHRPDFLFYIAGADVLATDKLGTLALTPQGCAERDELVFAAALRLGIPLVTVLGGGYSPRYADILDVHTHTFQRAAECFG
jgi:acetoin utilization deacetylase AcuC-like enzyme